MENENYQVEKNHAGPFTLSAEYIPENTLSMQEEWKEKRLEKGKREGQILSF